MPNRLRVAVIGAGAWARHAHIPGWQRDPRCEVVAICDLDRARAEDYATQFGIPEASDDWQGIVGRADVDVIDIVTPSHTHYELACAALEGGKHVLCEKPVAYDFRQTRAAAEIACQKRLKTKLGFTFRYSPGVQYARSLLDEGFVGTPFIFNGYEQNSQWLDPQVPLRQVNAHADQSILQTSSLEGYGAPIIDIGHWWVGADYTRVVGLMRNFIPERMVRATGQFMRMNIDDGDIFIGEYANGAIGSIQTSFVTVGNYPGVEARIYGDRGAIICRLVEEHGVAETIRLARPDAVEFDVVEIPQRFYPSGGHARESWRSLFYANLIRDFLDEISDGGERNQGNFEDGAWVQEVINAVEVSVHQRRWVDLPLPTAAEVAITPEGTLSRE
jgi:predicted dehydrogenase